MPRWALLSNSCRARLRTHAPRLLALLRGVTTCSWCGAPIMSVLLFLAACLDMSSVSQQAPPPYPTHIAIQAGTTYTLPRGLSKAPGGLTEPSGIADVSFVDADSVFVIKGVRAGFARWVPGLADHHPVWIAVLQDSGAGPIMIAHHGVSSVAPENTLVSVLAACELGIPGIEVDVRFTADSVPVLIHDRDVRRTSNGVGYVDEMKLVDLQKLDFGSWFAAEYTNERILTLDTFFQASTACGFNPIQLDIKSFAPVGVDSGFVRLGRAVNAMGILDRVQMGSFDLNTQRRGAVLIPGLHTVTFTYVMTSGYVDLLIHDRMDAVGIRFDAYLASPQQAGRLDSAGVSVGVWAPPGILDLNLLRPMPRFVTTDWGWRFAR